MRACCCESAEKRRKGPWFGVGPEVERGIITDDLGIVVEVKGVPVDVGLRIDGGERLVDIRE